MDSVNLVELVKSRRCEVTLTANGKNVTVEGDVEEINFGGVWGGSQLRLDLSNLTIQDQGSNADEDSASFDVRSALKAFVDDLDFQAAIDERSDEDFDQGAAFAYRHAIQRVEWIIKNMEVEND